MIYLEYDEYKIKYQNAQNEYNKILNFWEKLFTNTQPKATNLDKEILGSTKADNIFDNYLIQKENKKIDERLAESKKILQTRKELLLQKRQELEQSKDWDDIIYKYYYINKMSVRQISKLIPYSKSQVYERLNKLNINIGQNRKKSDKTCDTMIS